MKFSEKAYINRRAIIGHGIVDGVLAAAYLVELIKGARSLAYVAVFLLLCIGPVAAEIVTYRKNPDSGAIMHMVSIAYGTLYIVALFTANSTTAFAYAFPMFMVITLYRDVRCCGFIAAGAVIANIVYVVRHMLTVGYTAAELPDVETKLASVFLSSAFMILTAAAVRKVNAHQVQQLQAQHDAAEAAAAEILDTSNGMISLIGEAQGKTALLGESVEQIRNSMSEVSVGSTETAEAVQTQMQRTEQIQQHIVRVKDMAGEIQRTMAGNAEKVDQGRKQMETLANHVELSTNANSQVIRQMEELNEYAAKMNTIIETITSIADSTSLLALNASIEAARAGESGRGFAVVAGQISELANQTKTATVNVTALIDNIGKELESVGQAVEVVTKSNQANAESSRAVGGSFNGIIAGTAEAERHAEALLKIVDELEAANGDIVENIQTISAITEEVSAHAGETYNACEENARLVSSVTEIVTGLNEDAKTLQQKRI